MKRNEIFRYAEKCLYEYHSNLARLEVLREDLRVLRASFDFQSKNYQSAIAHYGSVSDPVANHVIKIQELEAQIKRLERNTEPITKLIESINTMELKKYSKGNEYKKILELFYFSEFSLSEVASKLKKSRQTISKRRQALVHKAVGYLGL